MKLFNFSFFFLFFSYILFYMDDSGIGQKLKWISVVFLLLITLMQFTKGIPKKLITNLPIWIFLIIFNLLGLITNFYISETVTTSVITLVGLDIYFLIFYFSSYIVSSKNDGIIKINKIIIITSAMLIIISFLVNLPLTLSQFHTYFYGRIRVYGIFQHPNYLGGVCFVSLVACFINLKLVTRYKKTLFLMLLFFLTCIILSDSRGGLYSFIIFLIVYYSVNITKIFKNPLIKTFMIFFSISCLLIIGLLSMDYISAYLYNADVNMATSGRISNWEFLLNNMILNNNINFLFGHGLSSVTYLQNLNLNTDNGFLVWMYEAGLLNLILVIILMLFLFNKAFRNKDLFSIAIFCSYITYALFENFLMNTGHIVAFYCWFYIFMNIHESKDTQFKVAKETPTL